jgi:hypothetical protein
LADVLADSVAYYRQEYDLTQAALAQLMTEVLGFNWTASTVAKVEKGGGKGGRRLTAEELIGLSLVLRTGIVEFAWRTDGRDPDHTGGDVLVGTTPVNNLELTGALRGTASPALPKLENLTSPAWAVVTGDKKLRELVDKEMADWKEGMRLLRREVTDAMERQERFRRWEVLAQQQSTGQDPEAVEVVES